MNLFLFIQRAVKPRSSGRGYKAHPNWNFCLLAQYKQVVKDSFGKDATSVFRNKDQVDIHSKNTVSSCAYFIDIFHRPATLLP